MCGETLFTIEYGVGKHYFRDTIFTATPAIPLLYPHVGGTFVPQANAYVIIFSSFTFEVMADINDNYTLQQQ